MPLEAILDFRMAAHLKIFQKYFFQKITFLLLLLLLWEAVGDVPAATIALKFQKPPSYTATKINNIHLKIFGELYDRK